MNEDQKTSGLQLLSDSAQTLNEIAALLERKLMSTYFFHYRNGSPTTAKKLQNGKAIDWWTENLVALRNKKYTNFMNKI